MYKIENVSITSCEQSEFIAPKRIVYHQEGIKKSWDMVEVHDSVAVLLYHTEKEAFVLVKQFRPPVYVRNGDGFTHELVAGIVDKELTLEQIVQEEIEEEVGYHVPLEKIEYLTSFFSAVGFAGSQQHLYFANVDASMQVSEGGGIDIEAIEVYYLPKKESLTWAMDATIVKTPALLFALQWYIASQ
ncbi:MAG TPA: NUDIX domain-containing protein [Helicobacteraceae bacterium]|nr:NUDIX domain-containing protein [Helicobacteraceae bacterium]